MVGFTRYAFAFLGLLMFSLAGCTRDVQEPEAKSPIIPKAGKYKFDKSDDEQPGSPSPKQDTSATEPKAPPPPPPPPPPPTIPEVLLSDELRATCLVDVDETMPLAELIDLEGKIHRTDSLYGPKLTVVCFWTIGSTSRSKLTAEAVLQDMMKKVVKQFAEQGVKVIAINVGDGGDDIKEYVAKAGAEFPVLLDSLGDYYAKIATERKNPRLFLLDDEGKILWFDLEYSNTALRNLVQGIEAALSEKQ